MWRATSFHIRIHEWRNANGMGLCVISCWYGDISRQYGPSAMVGKTNPWLPDDAQDLVTDDVVVDRSGELGLIFHQRDPNEDLVTDDPLESEG